MAVCSGPTVGFCAPGRQQCKAKTGNGPGQERGGKRDNPRPPPRPPPVQARCRPEQLREHRVPSASISSAILSSEGWFGGSNGLLEYQGDDNGREGCFPRVPQVRSPSHAPIVGGALMHHRMWNRIPGPHPLDASTPPMESGQPKMAPDMATRSLEDRTALGENQGAREMESRA